MAHGILQHPDKGPGVLVLTKILKFIGYLRVDATPHYSLHVADAVRAVQRARRIPVTGKVKLRDAVVINNTLAWHAHRKHGAPPPLNLEAFGEFPYKFPYPAMTVEGRVDRGQDMDSDQAHPDIVAVGTAVVQWTWGGWPELGILLTDGPLDGREIFYGHCDSIRVGNGDHVKAGQVLGTGGGPSEGGYDGHIEIGLWPVVGDVQPGTHNTESGNEWHAFLHKHWPDRIGRDPIIAG